MKSIPIVLLTICFFLSFNSSWITSAAGQDTNKSTAQAKPDDDPRAHCEQMASRLFKDNLEASRDKFQIFSNRHHYNKRLNKCFMLETFVRTPNDPTMLVIYDVNEKSIVAYCGSNSAREDKDCKSQRWKDLLTETMEE